MSGQYLLLDCEVPMAGPWVSCRGLEGILTVSGMVDGDRVRIHGRSKDGAVTDPTWLHSNGEHRLAITPPVKFLRAVREGGAGRVSVRVR